MKEKILNKLPSIKGLQIRIDTLKDKIRKCEGEIPVEFWCDDCKRLLQKIESLTKKKEAIEFETLHSHAHKLLHKLESAPRMHQGELSHYGPSLYQAYSQPTPTLKYYKCSRCGRIWLEGVHLGIYRDLDEHVDRCMNCHGIVEEITKPSRK